MPRKPARRAPKKPTMAKAKKMITKSNKAKAKKNMDTFFLRCRNVITLTPSQGGTVSNYVFQTFSMDPTGVGSLTYVDNAEFNLWKLQYDKFRVNSVTIKVTPKANVLDMANAQNDGSYNTTGDGLWHTCIDRDGKAVSSKSVISRYPSYRKYSVLKGFARTYSIKYPTGIWADCQSPGSFPLAKELGLSGTINMYAENILEDNYEIVNEPVCTVEVYYNIVFQGKVSTTLSGIYDASGNLTGVSVKAVDTALTLPVTAVSNITGTLGNDTRRTLDASGNVTEVPINDLGNA